MRRDTFCLIKLEIKCKWIIKNSLCLKQLYRSFFRELLPQTVVPHTKPWTKNNTAGIALQVKPHHALHVKYSPAGSSFSPCHSNDSVQAGTICSLRYCLSFLTLLLLSNSTQCFAILRIAQFVISKSPVSLCHLLHKASMQLLLGGL